tara:strand:- start:351 stop:1502 length:1152 start_codon:yes stop_codon:yes gene_type:complete
MKISIIVGGRFHAFNLAEQLNKKKYLKQLITSYPKYFVNKRFEISKDQIKSIYLKELVQRSFINKIYNFNDLLTEYFDLKAKSLLDYKDLDILIGWSSFSYHSFLNIKNTKCIKILERGSSHIEFQNEIINEEYLIQNIKPKPISKYIIEKEKKEYELADYIMVPSEFARKTFLEKGFDEKKIIKNPYGVDLKEFKSDLSTKQDQNKFRIIYTGTVSIRKGILYLLEAFNDLKLEDIELLIIGNIEKDLKKNIKKYKFNKNIIFKKSVNQSELRKFYIISHVFITCSIEEGLSMVQIQAMSCGLPVICTVNSGGEEIINDNIDGFILPIRDKIKLKEKIIYLYNNRNICTEMGKKAKKKATEHFSWEIYGQKAISIYQDLLNK